MEFDYRPNTVFDSRRRQVLHHSFRIAAEKSRFGFFSPVNPSTPLHKMATPAFVSVAQPAPVAGRVPVARHAPQAAPGESIGQVGSTADPVICEAHIVGSWNVHGKVGILQSMACGYLILSVHITSTYIYIPLQAYLPQNSRPVSQEMN